MDDLDTGAAARVVRAAGALSPSPYPSLWATSADMETTPILLFSMDEEESRQFDWACDEDDMDTSEAPSPTTLSHIEPPAPPPAALDVSPPKSSSLKKRSRSSKGPTPPRNASAKEAPRDDAPPHASAVHAAGVMGAMRSVVDRKPLIGKGAARVPQMPPAGCDPLTESEAWAWGLSGGCFVGAPTFDLSSNMPSLVTKAFEFCLAEPISVVRGVLEACDIDSSLFLSGKIAKQGGSKMVEVRRQTVYDEEDWHCTSQVSHVSVKEYVAYQTMMHERQLQGLPLVANEKADLIDFATNLDLDAKVWTPQNEQLRKLPPFLRPGDPDGMLGQYEHNILGLNCAQMYMKVSGCRTPGTRCAPPLDIC